MLPILASIAMGYLAKQTRQHASAPRTSEQRNHSSLGELFGSLLILTRTVLLQMGLFRMAAKYH